MSFLFGLGDAAGKTSSQFYIRVNYYLSKKTCLPYTCSLAQKSRKIRDSKNQSKGRCQKMRWKWGEDKEFHVSMVDVLFSFGKFCTVLCTWVFFARFNDGPLEILKVWFLWGIFWNQRCLLEFQQVSSILMFDFHCLSRWWCQIFFNFTPYLGKISNLTNIFQLGWNHQLVVVGMNIQAPKIIALSGAILGDFFIASERRTETRYGSNAADLIWGNAAAGCISAVHSGVVLKKGRVKPEPQNQPQKWTGHSFEPTCIAN